MSSVTERWILPILIPGAVYSQRALPLEIAPLRCEVVDCGTSAILQVHTIHGWMVKKGFVQTGMQFGISYFCWSIAGSNCFVL